MSATSDYTPALGHALLTPLYDAAIAAMTREGRWRGALLRQVSPAAGDVVLDVGCGTGTFALMLKRAAPEANVLGLDPDPAVLKRAESKAQCAGGEITFVRGFARDAACIDGPRLTKAVSSLVFHQLPMTEKRLGLRAMHDALAQGVLPSLMLEAGFRDVAERRVIPTPTGSISIYFARRPLERAS
jgi:SAM-dependent methyltransferase